MEYVKPADIEKRSFEIITKELSDQGVCLKGNEAAVILRCIHTTADFEYADTLAFSADAVGTFARLIRLGANVVTDTHMALSGLNRRELTKYGCRAYCFMADEDVREEAAAREVTRASVCVRRAMELEDPVIFVIGNAPTALITLRESMDQDDYTPAFVVGVPVGFVNVEAAKALFLDCPVPHIINRGRKGGSTVAAAICNAILYLMKDGRV